MTGNNQQNNFMGISSQNDFLNRLRKRQAFVTMYLVNGVKLQGVIFSFDEYSVFLKRDALLQMIYKHAIATVLPLSPVAFREEENRAGKPTPEVEDSPGY